MFALLLLVGGADPVPPKFIVEDKTDKRPVPAFVVDNKVTYPPNPFDLSKPSPPGWEKVSVNGGPWHFRKIDPAPGVAVANPLGQGTGMPGMTVPPADTNPLPVPVRGSSGVRSPAGTSTSAPRVILSGGTSCPNGNCPYR